jgi:predicted phage-related endonuclease
LKSKEIEFIEYDAHDRKKWLGLREQMSSTSIDNYYRAGGSDVGIILGLSKWKDAGSLFYEKVGLKAVINKVDLHQYRGIVTEDLIADKYFRYYDPEEPDPDVMIENSFAGKVIRDTISLPCMIQNKKYPNLFANVDRFIVEKPLKILEIKSILGSSMDLWEDGADPAYVAQTQTYMGVCELTESELFVLKDSTYPFSYPMQFSSLFFGEIIEAVNNFSANVVAARKKLSVAKSDADILEAVAEHEPPVQDTPAYTKFLKEIYQPDSERNSIDGPKEVFDNVIDYLKIKRVAKDKEAEAIAFENKIRAAFIKLGAYQFKFGKYGNISWKTKLYCPDSILQKFLQNQ